MKIHLYSSNAQQNCIQSKADKEDLATPDAFMMIFVANKPKRNVGIAQEIRVGQVHIQ